MGTDTAKCEIPTAYESLQIAEISAWKSETPHAIDEFLTRIAQPLTRVVEYIVPDRIAMGAIEAAYKFSDFAATTADIKTQAEVNNIEDLKEVPLEVCDRLAARVGVFAQGLATVEGAVTGAGGVWTTVLDIPLLFSLCLRAIIKIGHCYGYILDRPADQNWVLGAFAVSLSTTKQKRAALLARLKVTEDLLLEEAQEQVVVEEAAALLTQIEIFEGIPIFGTMTGALLNLAVVHKTARTARYLCQERWLRDNGKVDSIDAGLQGLKIAGESGDTEAPNGMFTTLARACRTTIYGASFGMTLPIWMAAAIVGSLSRDMRVAHSRPSVEFALADVT